MKHPNAAASGIAGAIAVVCLYAGTLLNFDPPSYVAGALTTIVIAAALVVGRSGFRGLARILWRGNP